MRCSAILAALQSVSVTRMTPLSGETLGFLEIVKPIPSQKNIFPAETVNLILVTAILVTETDCSDAEILVLSHWPQTRAAARVRQTWSDTPSVS